MNTVRTLAALIAATLLASTAQATIFNVQVWQGTGNGSGSDLTQLALPTSPLAAGTAIASFQYDGNVQWDAPSQATNTLSQFVGSGGGTISGCTGSACAGSNALGNVLLSAGGYSTATLMELTFTTTGPIAGTITHDDGISIFDVTNTTAFVSSANPTTAKSTSFSLGSAGTYHLWYNEDNGAPAVLKVNAHDVPEPGLLGLFGLGVVGLVARRRKALA